jgi:hypothetical protein
LLGIGRITSAVLGPVLALGLAASAQARVDVTAADRITGSAVVGAKLTASGATWSGPSGTTTGRRWLQCPTATAGEWSCAWLDNTNSNTFTVRPADKDKWLRVAFFAYKDWDYAYEVSGPTARIAAAPPRAPTPSPTPTPSPVATATPEPPAPVPPQATPEPVAEPPAAVPVATSPAPVLTAASPKPKLIRPYPTIRISGRLTAAGAKVTRLTVKAPKGVRITLTCRGPSCPVRKLARSTAVVHLPRFERELRAGTKLTITVSRRGHISKVTTITIRKGKRPARLDRCQYPGRSKLVRCPKR